MMANSAMEVSRLREEFEILSRLISSHKSAEARRLRPVAGQSIDVDVGSLKRQQLLSEVRRLKGIIESRRRVLSRNPATKIRKSSTCGTFKPPTTVPVKRTPSVRRSSRGSTKWVSSAFMSRRAVGSSHHSRFHRTNLYKKLPKSQAPDSSNVTTSLDDKMNSSMKPPETVRATRDCTPHRTRETSRARHLPLQGPQKISTRFKIVNDRGTKSVESPSPVLRRKVRTFSIQYVPVSQGQNQNAKRRMAAKTRCSPKPNVKAGSRQYWTPNTRQLKWKECKASTRGQKTTRRNSRTNKMSNKAGLITVRGSRFLVNGTKRTLTRWESPLGCKSGSPCTTASITANGSSSPSLCVTPKRQRAVSFASRSVNRSINRLVALRSKSKQFCLFFNKFGVCRNHQRNVCPYIHDPTKVAVCKRFLKGNCVVKDCPFSHELCRSKMEVCTFFLHGRCLNESCAYRHVNVNREAGFCKDFQKGFCPHGEKCKKWHIVTQSSTSKLQKRPVKSISSASVDRATTTPHRTNGVAECRVLDEESEERPQKKRLPSFIPLDMESDTEVAAGSENLEETPIRIRPMFLRARFSKES